MRYVTAEWDAEGCGCFLDPTAYLEKLPELRASLPPGAWAFVSDEGHYNMGSSRCVKDLVLVGIDLATDKSGALTLSFAPNPWKHEQGLRIRYAGVSHFSISYEGGADWMRTDDVLLDEVFPHEDGCLHEIALTDASIVVHCRDLDARWEDVAPPPGRFATPGIDRHP